MPAIRQVVFDIGNVLLSWEPHPLLRSFFETEAEYAAFLEETRLFAMNLEFDRGLPFETGVAQLVATHPHHAAPIEAFHHRWFETLAGPIPETVAILHELREAGVPVYAITNFAREKFDIARAAYPFLDLFDDIVVSADEKLVKPDPAIYRLLLDRRKLVPAETVFIDDSAPNIAAARDLGIHAIHFAAKDYPLRAELKALGLPLA